MLGLHRARVTHMQPPPRLAGRTETLVQAGWGVQSKLSMESNAGGGAEAGLAAWCAAGDWSIEERSFGCVSRAQTPRERQNERDFAQDDDAW
jgi:hypothetical protein